MSNLDMLKRQHGEMLDLIKVIEGAILINPELKSEEIARNINALSGKMKMHLMTEDKFLYPSLSQSKNPMIRNTANQFNTEMGGLAEAFSLYVQQYNVPKKIISNKTLFIIESQKVFKVIKERIIKEDQKLYPLVESNT